ERPQPDELRPEVPDPLQALKPLERLVGWQSSQGLGVELAAQRRVAESVQVLDLATEEAGKRRQLREDLGCGKAPQAVAVNVDRGTELATHSLFDPLRLAHGGARRHDRPRRGFISIR